MTAEDQIGRYLDAIPEPKQSDMRRLHSVILGLNPGRRLWFLDGKDESGKVVSNPGIGYGTLARKYANGRTKEGFQVGVSANSTGLSAYIMGLDNRKYLQATCGNFIGKANITAYCIKFKALRDINLDTLIRVVRDGIGRTHD